MSKKNKGTREYPRTINERVWYYERKTGILLVHEIRGQDGGYIRTDQIKIPYYLLRDSLKRIKEEQKGDQTT